MTAQELLEELASAISTHGDDLEIRIDDSEVTDTFVEDSALPPLFVIIGM